jgi:hypothetical protein
MIHTKTLILAMAFLYSGISRLGAEPFSLMVTDVDMLPSRWRAIQYTGTNVSPNVGLARDLIVNSQALRVTPSPINPVQGFTFDIAVFNTQVPWDPAVLGAIETVDFRSSFIINSGIQFAPMLYQDGTLYVASRHQEPANFGVRQSLEDGFTIDQFTRHSGPGPVTLDFSTGASEIFFGLNARKPSFLGTGTFRFADVKITATAVPEPDTASFLATGLACCIAGHRLIRKEPSRRA